MSNKAAHVLNDGVIARLADIYLSFLNIPTCEQAYRRIKNAVILCAFVYDDMQSVYAELESIDTMTAAEIKTNIAYAVTRLPQPIEVLFNSAYCADAQSGFMPEHKSVDEQIAFLGKTFLYITETNYPPNG